MPKKSCFLAERRPPIYDLNLIRMRAFKLRIQKGVGSSSRFTTFAGVLLVYG